MGVLIQQPWTASIVAARNRSVKGLFMYLAVLSVPYLTGYRYPGPLLPVIDALDTSVRTIYHMSTRTGQAPYLQVAQSLLA